jgi:hypothetical protein
VPAAVPPAHESAQLTPRSGLRHQVRTEPRTGSSALRRYRFRADRQHRPRLRRRMPESATAGPEHRHSAHPPPGLPSGLCWTIRAMSSVSRAIAGPAACAMARSRRAAASIASASASSPKSACRGGRSAVLVLAAADRLDPNRHQRQAAARFAALVAGAEA